PSNAGQAVTFTVTMTPVSNGAPLDLQISNPPTPLIATWSAGQTVITTANLSVGTHTVTGVWFGDANVLAGSSSVLVQTVQMKTTTTSLVTTPNPSVFGGSVTLTATVSPAGATGTVWFYNSGVPLLSAPVVSGAAQASIATLPVGSNSITAVYSGDYANGPSTSFPVAHVVNGAGIISSVTLISSANPSIAGRPLWLTATVSPATASGTVQFLEGATALGTGTLANGWATLQLSSLPVGTHSITAVYSGDVNHLASTSATLSQNISPASPSTVTPAIITTLASASVGVGIPVIDATGNIYFPDGFRIVKRTPDGVLNAIAGNGQQGTAGDGGPALSASLGLIRQLALHGSRICFSDMLAGKVRCVDLGTGLIQGYGNLSNPAGTAFDDAGNIYVSESGGARVSRIDALTSTVTLFAGRTLFSGLLPGDGGPAVGANLNAPGSLAYYNSAIYIADTGNQLIRRVDLATGMISSVAFVRAQHIAMDPSGNLFFNSGLTIDMMDPSGNITPIANSRDYSGQGDDDILATDTVFSGPPQFSWDPLATRLLIGDQARLRQVFFTPPTTTALVLSPNPVSPGGQVALQATVSPATATGSVRFYQGRLLLGSSPLVNGGASFSWTAPIGGNPSAAMRAVYGGDANLNLSTSATITETVQQGATVSTTSLAVTPNPSLPGAVVSLVAAISPAPATGVVAFYSNGILAGTAPVSGGQARFSIATLHTGSNLLMAQYGGDFTYAGSSSSMVTQIVAAAPSVTLTSGANPSAYGQSVTFSAALVPATASGSVQFLDGATVLGTGTIANGSASLSVSTLAAGNHSVTAVYSGDTNNYPGASAAVTQTVQQASTATTLTSNIDRTQVGQNIPLSVTVTPATASGSVNLMKGATVLATSALVNGAATFNVANLPVGANSLFARYAGDASYAPSSSSTVVQVVLMATSIVLTTSPNPSAYGAAVGLTVTASPTSATGPVQFNNGNIILGTASLVKGKATLSVANLPVGPAALVAYYSGDDTHTGFTSLIVTQTVNKSPSSVKLTSGSNPSVAGQNVVFSVVATPGAATGIIKFLDGSAVLGTATISGGTASLTVSTLSTGAHSITAAYNGDAAYLAAVSPVLTQTVSAPALACHVVYTVTGQWPGGFGTAITIKNTGSAVIKGWNLTWTWPGNQTITQAWNASNSQTGTNAKLTNMSYNSDIAAGATLSGIGFNGSWSGSNTSPASFYLNGALCK
ncbi:MAG: Ig-like domain repeat protein, partial [Candidatus Solibacter sp.]